MGRELTTETKEMTFRDPSLATVPLVTTQNDFDQLSISIKFHGFVHEINICVGDIFCES